MEKKDWTCIVYRIHLSIYLSSYLSIYPSIFLVYFYFIYIHFFLISPCIFKQHMLRYDPNFGRPLDPKKLFLQYRKEQHKTCHDAQIRFSARCKAAKFTFHVMKSVLGTQLSLSSPSRSFYKRLQAKPVR